MSPIAGRHVITVAGREVELRTPLSELQAQAVRQLVAELRGSFGPSDVTTDLILRGGWGRRLFVLLASPPDGSDWDETWSRLLLAHLARNADSELVLAAGPLIYPPEMFDELGRILRGDT